MTADIFTPLLTTTDWNEEWKRMQDARGRADDASVWDARAKTYPVKHGSQKGYVASFIELAGVKPGETVLDMGCGTGALATPLAQAGNHVIACDFSRGMIDAMLADQKELGVTGVEAHHMSWTDDWNEVGIGENSVDVAFASRSIATYDLRQSLMKLNEVARRRVCITLPSGPSSKSDPELLEAAGISNSIGCDFLYAFIILANEGITPEVAYIPNTRLETFDSFNDALGAFSEIAASAAQGLASESEIADIPHRLRPWLEERLIHDERGFHLSEERQVTWAFISWNK